MTPYGHAGMQYPQPLQTSSCTTTVPNSVRKSAPVGQTSRQAAWVQCLQTSDDISQRTSTGPSGDWVVASRSGCGMSFGSTSVGGGPIWGIPRSVGGLRATFCSMNATCRQVSALSIPVLSYDMPSMLRPSSWSRFHSLQATSQLLQPMQTLVSVKKPIRGVDSSQPASAAGDSSGP